MKFRSRLFAIFTLALSVMVGLGTPLGDALPSLNASAALATEPDGVTPDGAADEPGATPGSGEETPVESVPTPEPGEPAPTEPVPTEPAPTGPAPTEPAPDDLSGGQGAELAPDAATETPELERSAEEGTLEAPQARSIAPFAAGDSTTPQAYFSLRQQGTPGGTTGDGRGTISAIIDKYVVNASNPSAPTLTAQSASHPTQSVSVPLEGDRQPDVMPAAASGATQVQYRVRQSDFNANSLGVASDGIAYFTTQFYLEQRQRSAYCNIQIIFCLSGWGWREQDWSSWSTPGTSATRYLSIWQVDLEGATPVPTAPVVQRNTALVGSNTVTGGAVRADGRYHFSYLVGGGTNAINYRVYRLVGTTPTLAVDATTANGTSIGSFSGDIAFDGYDNLFLLVGGTGTSSRLAMLRADQTPATGNTTVTNLASSVITQQTPVTNGQPAGLAFPFPRFSVWQGGSSHSLRNMASPNTVVSTQNYPGFADQRDLASIVKRPTFQLKLVLDDGRAVPGDQFVLSAAPGASPQTRPTSGAEGEASAAALTGSPIPVTRALDGAPLPNTTTNPAATIPFSVTAGPGTDLGNYAQAYQCADLSSGATVVTGTGAAGSAAVSTLGNSNVECTVTLTRTAPDLVVTKQAFVGGSALAHDGFVEAESVVEYRLTFNNAGGTAAATGIDFTDDLADVLDDADFVAGSLSITPSGGLSVSGIDGSGALTGETLRITGTVSQAATIVVKFSVTVKANDADVEARSTLPPLTPPAPAAGETQPYDLNNYLVATGEVTPTECAGGDLCTSNPVRAWNVTKRSQPGSGATMNIGGTPNYTIVVEKSDAAMPLEGVQVVDDLTDVLKVAQWDPAIVPPAPALPQGIYFYDTDMNLVGSHTAANSTLTDWIPAPVYTDTPGGGTWTLTTAEFDLPPNAKYAHVRFSVRLGTPQAAPAGSQHWNPAVPPEPDTTFTNRAWASADGSGLEPNRCVVGIPAASLPDACTTTHTLVSAVVAFRKDGIITNPDGTREKIEDLAGHEFVIYQAGPSGEVTENLPANACEFWNDPTATDPGDPANCWRFYPIPDGEQQGRWRSHNLTAGNYWLVETKAADQRNVGGVLEPLTQVQLLAEPIPFRVASSADAAPTGSVQIENGQPAYLRVGQLDVYRSTTAATGSVNPRCDTVNWPTACVNPTGYLMIVSDVRLAPLPLAGGLGPALITSVGAVALLGAAAGALWWRRRQQHLAVTRPSTIHPNIHEHL